MTPELFDAIQKILTENEVSHSISFDKGEIPTDLYSVHAKYKTTDQDNKVAVLKIAHNKNLHLFKIYIGNKCAYAHQYTKLSKAPSPISVSISEDEFIRNILLVCKNKTENAYLDKLNQLRTFLNDLNKQQEK